MPTRWSATENVLWKTPIPGVSHASPIVWGDRVFVTLADRQTREQETAKQIPDHHVACFRVADGSELWRTKIAPVWLVAAGAILGALGHTIYSKAFVLAPAAVLQPFIDAARELIDEGCVAIGTSCGFLALWQRELQQALPVPVWT